MVGRPGPMREGGCEQLKAMDQAVAIFPWLSSIPDPQRPRSAGGCPQLFINGRFLVQQATGVQRVASEVVSEIDSLAGRGELGASAVLLVPPGPWVQSLALHHIAVETVGRSRGVLWEQFELPARAKGGTLLCLGNTAPALALLRRDTDVAVMIHDVSFLDHPRAYTLRYRLAHRWMLPLLMNRARRIFTVSHSERDRLVALAPATAPRITVASNGGWSERHHQFAQAGHGAVQSGQGSVALPAEPFGLYVGSLSHRKNFTRTLEAAIRMAREDGLHFVFVGASGKVLREPERSVPHDVMDRIRFLGQINDAAQLAHIYGRARVLLFPSLYEASPLPPVEAAYFGCPVVVSNIASMWERCGRGAVYCDPLSTASIVAAARRVLHDSPERDAVIRAGREMAKRYRWADQATTLHTHLPR